MEQLDDWQEPVSEEAGEWDDGLAAKIVAEPPPPPAPLLIASSLGLCVPSLGFPAETEQAGNEEDPPPPPEAANPAAVANMRPGILLLPPPPDDEVDLLFS